METMRVFLYGIGRMFKFFLKFLMIMNSAPALMSIVTEACAHTYEENPTHESKFSEDFLGDARIRFGELFFEYCDSI